MSQAGRCEGGGNRIGAGTQPILFFIFGGGALRFLPKKEAASLDDQPRPFNAERFNRRALRSPQTAACRTITPHGALRRRFCQRRKLIVSGL
jgi:hypothetical protein